MSPAGAELPAVDPIDGATGYPSWDQDTSGTKLALCLEGPPHSA